MHGHYSVEKAAVTCGLGSAAVWTVPVDTAGRMDASALRALVIQAKAEGKTPLYVNATAGTTVLGSYDPFEAIAEICREFNLWLHIDASWGGPAIFSSTHRHKLAGSHLANSLTVNPHKMLNVPVTCSFLLGPDMAVFHRANTLPAGYLFHSSPDDTSSSSLEPLTSPCCSSTPSPSLSPSSEPAEIWDLADLTLQCGRRADSLKLFLSWVYHGASGFSAQVDSAFDVAAHLATLLTTGPHAEDFVLVSENPPPCLQVCFYYKPVESKEENTRRTREMVGRLVRRGYMVDYAPGERGGFFRVVVNCVTRRGTVEGLVRALVAVGGEVVGEE